MVDTVERLILFCDKEFPYPQYETRQFELPANTALLSSEVEYIPSSVRLAIVLTVAYSAGAPKIIRKFKITETPMELSLVAKVSFECQRRVLFIFNFGVEQHTYYVYEV